MKSNFFKISLILFTLLVTPFIFSSKASAALGDPCSLKSNAIFSIPAWYKYLPGEIAEVERYDFKKDQLVKSEVCQPVVRTQGSEKTLPKSAIILIIAAVLEMLIRITGWAVLIYAIYGGFLYLTSQGNPEQVKRAGSALLNGIIGLAIAISATTLVNFLARQLSA